MDTTVNNEELIPRLEVLRLAVYGAQQVFDEFVNKRNDNEFSGLLTAFSDFEDVLEKYIGKAEPAMSCIYSERKIKV